VTSVAGKPQWEPSEPPQWAPVEAPPWAEKPERARAWSDVPLEALRNVPASAVEFGRNIVQPFIHPIDTAQSLGQLGGGVLQHLGIMKGEEYEPYADAVGKFLMDRYGSIEGIKNTMATDPVGLAADLSMLLTGGGSAAARTPGLIGKVGEAAAAAGRLTNPLTAAEAVAAPVGRAVGRIAAEATGLMTHTGAEPLIQAAKAGREGGQAAEAFRGHLTGTGAAEEPVTDAMAALKKLREERGDAYRDAMAKLGPEYTDKPLNFDKVDQALAASTRVKTFKGVPIDPETQGIRQKIAQTIQDWKMLPADRYHTAEGLDALKQRIGVIRDTTQFGTPERVVANQAYNALRQTVVDQAPGYAKIMRGYELASRRLEQLHRELSIPTPDKGRIDTALRKLQSALRNNVNTSFGRRKELTDFLVRAGAPNLMYKLAGQALQPALPRGLGRLATDVGIKMASLFGLGAVGGPSLALAVPTALASSPRLMGETAYWGGVGARKLGKVLPERGVAPPLAQVGRVPEEEANAQRRPYAKGGGVRTPGGTRGRPKGERALVALRKARERTSKALPDGRAQGNAKAGAVRYPAIENLRFHVQALKNLARNVPGGLPQHLRNAIDVYDKHLGQAPKRFQEGGEVNADSRYDTKLEPDEESKFQQWKQENAPRDSGADYDLRGAFKAGVTPDVDTGHWPDTFKKPNHPTFSDQSQYAKDRPDLAGHWEGDQYVPPRRAQEPWIDPMSGAPTNEESLRTIGRGAYNIAHGLLVDLPKRFIEATPGVMEGDPETGGGVGRATFDLGTMMAGGPKPAGAFGAGAMRRTTAGLAREVERPVVSGVAREAEAPILRGNPELRGSMSTMENVPFTYRGKSPAEWTPQEFKEVGQHFDVPNLGPESKPKAFQYDNGETFNIPGGLSGEFTYYDLLRMKADGIDPSRIPRDLHAQLHQKLMRTMDMPQPVSPEQTWSGLMFGMTSPNNPLFPNQLTQSILRMREPGLRQQLADAIPWKAGDEGITVKQRLQASDRIANMLGISAAERGGLGTRGSMDYTRIAELAQMYEKNPRWFTKTADETWPNYVERLASQVPGLSMKTGSFGGVWQDPMHAGISAIDRHMINEFERTGTLFPSAAEKTAFQKRAVERWNNANEDRPVRNYGQLKTTSGSKGFLTKMKLEYVGNEQQMKLRMASGEINPRVPPHLAGIDWPVEPERVKIMGDAYRRALAWNQRLAEQHDMNLFPSQWMEWDRIRRRFEPHENMFPGLEKMPAMSRDQLRQVSAEHTASGHKAYGKQESGTEEGQMTLAPTRPRPNPSRFAYFTVPPIAAAPGLQQIWGGEERQQ
jgi:hypothetical protein